MISYHMSICIGIGISIGKISALRLVSNVLQKVVSVHLYLKLLQDSTFQIIQDIKIWMVTYGRPSVIRYSSSAKHSHYTVQPVMGLIRNQYTTSRTHCSHLSKVHQPLRGICVLTVVNGPEVFQVSPSVWYSWWVLSVCGSCDVT